MERRCRLPRGVSLSDKWCFPRACPTRIADCCRKTIGRWANGTRANVWKSERTDAHSARRKCYWMGIPGKVRSAGFLPSIIEPKRETILWIEKKKRNEWKIAVGSNFRAKFWCYNFSFSYPVPKEWPQTKTGAVPLTFLSSHCKTNLLSATTPFSDKSAGSLSP